jgi:DNA replication protein DnaC
MNTPLLLERLKKVGWHHTANQLDGILEDASKNNVTYSDFLYTLLGHEMEQKESIAFERRMARAKLPFRKTIHDFDFSFQLSIQEKRVKEVLTCRYITSGENIVLLGPPGVGKTHLAISFGVEAITQGYSTLFITADDFVSACRKAQIKGNVERFIQRWLRPDVLIIDEVGYFPFDEMSANLFFQVVSKRYEKGSIILTSNKSYIEWGKVFGDEVLATAILDRLMHHVTTFNIKGNSYRLKEKQKAGILPAQVEH